LARFTRPTGPSKPSANAQADIVALGRSLLDDPYCPLHAARQRRVRARWPEQYERGDIV
jgi:hypothetical protein